jgi:N-acetylglucosaminyldiphosphoundecaprenol N-acetyl-beta-D-mannosaminyltransferase
VSVNAARRVRVGKLPIDAVDFDGALDAIDDLVAAGQGGTVFTPNVDHVVLAEDDPRLCDAYDRSSLSLVDGTPVLWASRMLGAPLPAKVSGSDLIGPLLARAAERNYRVYIVGGTPRAVELSRQKLARELPSLQIVGVEAGRVDVEGTTAEGQAMVERVRSARPDLVLVALGAPKQEIWSQIHREQLKPAVMIGVGGSFDFVAGIVRRSPRWMSKAGLEWLYRLMNEPRRLAGRYLLRDPKFFWIVARQALTASRS